MCGWEKSLVGAPEGRTHGCAAGSRIWVQLSRCMHGETTTILPWGGCEAPGVPHEDLLFAVENSPK